MTEPIGKKRPRRSRVSSRATRVQSGDYTIEVSPESTPVIRVVGVLFTRWQKNYPPFIAALYAGLPTSFEGFDEEVAEMKLKRRTVQGVHFEHETPDD